MSKVLGPSLHRGEPPLIFREVGGGNRVPERPRDAPPLFGLVRIPAPSGLSGERAIHRTSWERYPTRSAASFIPNSFELGKDHSFRGCAGACLATIVATDERHAPDDDRHGHQRHAQIDHTDRAGEGIRVRCVCRARLIERWVGPR